MKRMSIILPFLLALCWFALSEPGLAREKGGAKATDNARLYSTTQQTANRTLVNVGQLAMWIYSNARSAIDPGGDSGVTFPRGNTPNTAVIFEDGLVWGGKVQDGSLPELRVGGGTYVDGNDPGAILEPGVNEDRSDRENVDRIWRVRRDYPTADLRQDAAEINQIQASQVTDAQIAAVRALYREDWIDWPTHKGAPFYDVDGDGEYNPGFRTNDQGIEVPKLRPGPNEEFDPALHADEPGVAGADQVVWLVANDLESSTVRNLYGSPPIGLETQVTLWAYRRADALGQIIFKQFRFIYKGTATTPPSATIDSMHVCQWSDPDLGSFGDDFVGSDTTLSLGFAYNSNNNDAIYSAVGLPPPAAGYDFFAGPLVPDPDATAIFGLQRREGFRNLPMTTFGFFAAGGEHSDPDLQEYEGTLQWWNLLRGFVPRPESPPEPWINEVTGEPTKFVLTGDPATGEGWIDSNPGDRRLLLASGPFDMAVGDTQEVVVALLAALGSDRISSVQVLKFVDTFAQTAFDSLFVLDNPPETPVVRAAEVENKIVLNWGFNFNAVSSTEDVVQGIYEFEGYNVYQLPSAGAPISQGIKLATFDRNNDVTNIIQQTFDQNTGLILDLPVQQGTDTGIQRTFTIDRDFIRERDLVNGQTYYFGVTAYSYTPEDVLVRSLESPPSVVTVVPQTTKPGVRYSKDVGAMVDVVHAQGNADASIMVEVVDPTALIDATYTLEFDQDTTFVTDSTFTTEILWDVFLNGESVFPAPRSNLLLSGAGALDQLPFNGLLVRAGQVGFDAPITIFDDEFTFDADPSDAGLELWGDATLFGAPTGFYNVFGNGVPDPSLEVAQADVQFRFTGMTAGEVTDDNDAPVVEGGSMSTQWERASFGEADLSGFANVPVRIPFEVWINVEDNEGPDGLVDVNGDDRQINCAVINRNADGISPYGDGVGDPGAPGMEPRWRITGRDYIIPIYTDYDPDATHFHNDPNTAWLLFFHQGGADVWSTGDVYSVIFANPVVEGVDQWEFSTSAPVSSQDVARQDALDLINVFPNPYVGFNAFENNRFQRRITFSHLPDQATIRIFNLAGVLVRTLQKDDATQFRDWDLKNEDGLPVASGLYIAHIEMPGLGATKILKLALIQEEQFLRNF